MKNKPALVQNRWWHRMEQLASPGSPR